MMNKVKIVPNKKTGAMFVPSTSGKWQRVQLTQESMRENNGFFSEQKLTGFAYFATEALAEAFVQDAVNNGMVVNGKIIYVDQLEPINTESAEYGKQYPYPFRFDGRELSVEERLMIQAKCVETGLSLQQSGKAIYRRKMFTTDITKTSVVLSPDNQEDINMFIGTLLTAKAAPDPAKVARLAELRAIAKSSRNAAQKKELAELVDELEG
jgi:hypothetical protein